MSRTAADIGQELGEQAGQVAAILNANLGDNSRTWDTGGGCVVVVWHVAGSEQVVALSDQYVCNYASEDAMWDGIEGTWGVGILDDDTYADALAIVRAATTQTV